MNTKIILASGSPRRRELIKYISENIEIIPSDVDETVYAKLLPRDIPAHLALRKASDIAEKYKDALVIGCDTSVLLDGEVLGKPKDKEDAKRMLKFLSGKTQMVVTGCALVYGDKYEIFSEESYVTFYELSDKEIDDYLNLDEYKDKAGAYAIQGYGMLFVKEISGDYQNIVGLPVARLKREIDKFLEK